MFELDEIEIQRLYAWIDAIPLSRSKKNIARDFSDGVLVAEVVRHFIPKLIELHNYSPANSISQKFYNWNTLNQRVFKKLHYSTSDEIISCIVNCRPGYIEYLLFELRLKIEAYLKHPEPVKRKSSSSVSLNRPKTPEQTIYDSRLQTKKPDDDLKRQEQSLQRSLQGSTTNLDKPMTKKLSNPHLNRTPINSIPNMRHNDHESIVNEMRETINILQLKVNKLEQLLILKDHKIDELTSMLQHQ
ncbi:hypothetical protein EDD86DRAFT_211370 [Gorgonomyces haynaldii]|nr:hypothetical protein EDD86DRAFT_211370 [Gorgonomyces haynaldii]